MGVGCSHGHQPVDADVLLAKGFSTGVGGEGMAQLAEPDGAAGPDGDAGLCAVGDGQSKAAAALAGADVEGVEGVDGRGRPGDEGVPLAVTRWWGGGARRGRGRAGCDGGLVRCVRFRVCVTLRRTWQGMSLRGCGSTSLGKLLLPQTHPQVRAARRKRSLRDGEDPSGVLPRGLSAPKPLKRWCSRVW